MSTELCFFKIQWDLLGKHISAGVPATFEPEGGLPAIKSMLLRAQGGSRDASDVRRWCVEHLYGSLRRIEDLETANVVGMEAEALTHSLPEHIQKLPLVDRIKCVQSALAPKSVTSVADEAFKGHVYASLPQAIRDLPPVEQINQIQKFFADEPIKQSLKTLNDAEAFRSLKARLVESKQFTQAQMDSEPLDVLFSRALCDTSIHDAETKILKEETAKFKRLSESRLTLYNDAMEVTSSAMVLLKDYTGNLLTRVKAVLRDAQKVKVTPVAKDAPEEACVEETPKALASPVVVNDPEKDKEIERLRGEVYLGNQEIKRMLRVITELNMDLRHAKSTCKIYYTGWKRAEKAVEHVTPEGLARLAAVLVKTYDQGQPVSMTTETTGIGTEKDILDAVEDLLGHQAQSKKLQAPAQDAPVPNPMLKNTISVGEHQLRLTDFWRDEDGLPRSMCFASDQCAKGLNGLKIYPMVATYIREDLIPSQAHPEEKASKEAPESIVHKMAGILSKELEIAESNVVGSPYVRMTLIDVKGQTSTVDFSDVRVVKGTQTCQGIVFKPGKSVLDPAVPVVDTNSLVLVAAWNGQAPADWDPAQPSHVSVSGLEK